VGKEAEAEDMEEQT